MKRARFAAGSIALAVTLITVYLTAGPAPTTGAKVALAPVLPGEVSGMPLGQDEAAGPDAEATVFAVATRIAEAPPPIESLGADAMAGEVLGQSQDPLPEPTIPPRRPHAAFTPIFDPDATRAVAPTLTPLPSAIGAVTPRSESTRPPVPAAAPSRVGALVRVPILMYHYISDPPPNADRIRIDLSVGPAMFEQQLRYLRDNGYTTIGLDDLYAALSAGSPLPARPVVLTFDDGYRDAYETALPLLRKYGMRGTFFIVTDFVHASHPAYVTWPMVRAMFDAGMAIENHTRSHADLRRRADDFLVWQMLGAIESIQAYTGKRPRFLCYPGGFFDDNTIRVARSAGVLAAVTTQFGREHSLADALTWTRVRIRGEGTLREFADLIR